MKVEILTATNRINGHVGDIVDVAAPAGNYLAGFGVVRIVQHDPVGEGARSELTTPPKDTEIVDDPDKE